MVKVFVNGTFDIIHTGHLDLLFYAKSLGDYLHVAIDTDNRVAQHKGMSRPVNPLHIRKAVLAALKPVDSVSVFGSDEELINTIKTYSPDIIVKGSDWRGKYVIGAEHSRQLIYYERTNGESTTKIIEDFIDRRQLL